MRPASILSLVLLLALPLAAPAAAAADDRKELRESFALESGQAVRLELQVAELRVEGGDGDRVRAELSARCKWGGSDCKEALEALRLVSRGDRRRLVLELEGHTRWSKAKLEVEGTLIVPRGAETEIDLGVGTVEVKGLTGDQRIDLGVGEVKLWLASAAVRSVTLDAGVGDASIFGAGEPVEGRRPLLVGSEVYWDKGGGSSRVIVDVGVGEISVWLE